MLLNSLLQIPLLTSVLSQASYVLFVLLNNPSQPQNLLLKHSDLELQVSLVLGNLFPELVELLTLLSLAADYFLQSVKFLVEFLNHNLVLLE